MQLRLAFVALACLFGLATAGKARYDNYQVYRVVPTTLEQFFMLRDLQSTITDFSFWKEAGRLNDNANIMVAPHRRVQFEEIMKNAGLEPTIQIEDVQKLFDEEAEHMANTPKSTKAAIGWTSYYTLADIYKWLDELAAANSNVEVVNAGKTYEGRDIKGIKITNGKLPGAILESGIHAREWIGPAATSWIVNEIINAPATSTLKKFNYVYFPVTNPDGFEYTHNKDRAWRKTRSPHKSGLLTCYGVDPNRNWNFEWMHGGASSNACAEDFGGPSAFSELETKSLSDYLTSIHADFDIYIAFHSFSQLLMYPWGYTGADTPLEATWKRIGLAAAADLKAVHGTEFEVGSIFDTIYQASGSSIEWYYGKYNSTLTFVFELRDTGKYGFALPADQIIPSGEELLQAILRFLTEYQKLPAKSINN